MSPKSPNKKSKNVGGRPRKITSPTHLREEFLDYVKLCKKEKLILTKTGFKAHLIVNHGYLNDLPASFSEVKNRIDGIMEANYEQNMLTSKNYGAWIFALTNHHKRTNQRIQSKNTTVNKNIDMKDLSEDQLKEILSQSDE